MEKTNEENEEKIIKAKNHNARLFPFYKMFSWDLLFFYSINFLFFSQEKHFSASDILLLDCIYTIFKFVTQLPSINVAERLGKRRSLILANVAIATSIVIAIFAEKLWHVRSFLCNYGVCLFYKRLMRSHIFKRFNNFKRTSSVQNTQF